MAQTPFYFDWTFWAVVFSFLALALSQLPPIHVMFRRAKLDVEAYSRIHLTHRVGNPNAQLHLIVSNVGGREVKVKSIVLHFKRGNDDQFTLPAQNYLQAPGDKDTVLLTSFKLKPKDEWAHIVTFLNFFSRTDEKAFRQIESNLKNDIFEKKELPANKDKIVEAAPGNIQPVIEFFQHKFRWEPGEYEITLEIKTEPQHATVLKCYRVTLFESDSAELLSYAEDYKVGAGVYWHIERHTGLILPLTEA